MDVGVLGLGAMGTPMAHNLLESIADTNVGAADADYSPAESVSEGASFPQPTGEGGALRGLTSGPLAFPSSYW